MHKFGFVLVILLSFIDYAYAADKSPTVAVTHQAHSDARTKQTFDKTTATSMPIETAQRLRGDQLELNLIQEQMRAHTDALTNRIHAVLAEYNTQIQDVEFDTGAIRRAPKPPSIPPAPPALKPVKK